MGLVFGISNLTVSNQQLGSFKITALYNRNEITIFSKEGDNSCR